MFHLVFALPWLYVVTRTIVPLPWMIGFKLAVALILLIGSQFHFWSRLSSGSVFTPEFPRAVVILFNWAFGAIALLAVFQITLDLAGLIAAIGGMGGAGAWIEARYVIGITPSRWPPSGSGRRPAFLE